VASPCSRSAEAHVGVAVIGAGVLGLACAVALARRGESVVVLEQHGGPGRETSSRNSGVVHAGLYYPPGSLKARLCVEGRERLYRWCHDMKVPIRRTGKLVVATEQEQVSALEALAARGRANGAGALRLLDAAELAEREPALRGVAALWSPESGLVDAHGVVHGLLSEARSLGCDVAWKTSLRAVEPAGDGHLLHARDADGAPVTLGAEGVVNAAGLAADRVASMAGLDVDARGFRQHPCKGQYFALSAAAPRPRTPLVYPLPDAAGLGIHLTVDLGGRCIAGPDAAYVSAVDYTVDPALAPTFARAVARYLPGVATEHFTPDYAGIRPKLQGPGEGFRDFVIEQDPPGVVHLLGMESPGLTAALAVGEHVARLLAP
jgi:L-2-hydroxyglutarate oxidase LhgO